MSDALHSGSGDSAQAFYQAIPERPNRDMRGLSRLEFARQQLLVREWDFYNHGRQDWHYDVMCDAFDFYCRECRAVAFAHPVPSNPVGTPKLYRAAIRRWQEAAAEVEQLNRAFDKHQRDKRTLIEAAELIAESERAERDADALSKPIAFYAIRMRTKKATELRETQRHDELMRKLKDAFLADIGV